MHKTDKSFSEYLIEMVIYESYPGMMDVSLGLIKYPIGCFWVLSKSNATK